MASASRPGPDGDALYAPRHTLLDRVLADSARRAGAELQYGQRLVALRRDAVGRIRGGTLLDGSGRRRDVHTDLVVGADGMGSGVARLAGASVMHEGRHASVVIYGHWSGLQAEGYHWYYNPGVSAGVIPMNDGPHCVFMAMPQARLWAEAARGAAALYQNVLAACSPALAEAVARTEPQARLVTFGGRCGYLRQACGAGRRHGLLQGPADRARHDRCAARRRVARACCRLRQRGRLCWLGRDARGAVPAAACGDRRHRLLRLTLDELRLNYQALNQAIKPEVAHLDALGPFDPNLQEDAV